MKLEDQVVSLELAKRLKELGVKQESLFVWVNRFPWKVEVYEDGNWSSARMDAAFTVAELGEMLPRGKVLPYRLKTGSKPIWYSSAHLPVDGPSDMDRSTIQESNEANARAKMLIYLLENGLLH